MACPPRLTASEDRQDRKSTRLNSSHTVIYTLSLHDALPISEPADSVHRVIQLQFHPLSHLFHGLSSPADSQRGQARSEEHTSELQSHSDLHSFPTRRSSDLRAGGFGPSRDSAPIPPAVSSLPWPVLPG